LIFLTAYAATEVQQHPELVGLELSMTGKNFGFSDSQNITSLALSQIKTDGIREAVQRN
jgi:hypothetical protein